MEALEKAIELAARAHAGQVDKAGEPYILHPLRVVMKMETNTERIVAVLHDTYEDTWLTEQHLLAAGFDDEAIFKALDSVTKREGETYMEFIQRAKENSIGRKVKLADLRDNLDIKRIKNPTEQDYKRLDRYNKALVELIE